MHQEVHATVRVTLEAPAELSQGQLLHFIKNRTAWIMMGTPGVRKVELLGVLEEAEIYHPEGIK